MPDNCGCCRMIPSWVKNLLKSESHADPLSVVSMEPSLVWYWVDCRLPMRALLWVMVKTSDCANVCKPCCCCKTSKWKQLFYTECFLLLFCRDIPLCSHQTWGYLSFHGLPFCLDLNWQDLFVGSDLNLTCKLGTHFWTWDTGSETWPWAWPSWTCSLSAIGLTTILIRFMHAIIACIKTTQFLCSSCKFTCCLSVLITDVLHQVHLSCNTDSLTITLEQLLVAKCCLGHAVIRCSCLLRLNESTAHNYV